MTLKIIIFDMNKLEIEKEKEYELEEFLGDEIDLNSSIKGCNQSLNLLGLKAQGLKIKLVNSEKFIWYVINNLFKGFEIINKNRYELGHPDYLLKKGNEEIYLELKIGVDSLRTSQLKWFIENKDKTNKVLVIDWDPEFYSLKQNPEYI